MLSKYPNKTLKIGAPVSLSPQSNYAGGHANPVGIRGKVTALHGEFGGPGWVQIDWENETRNSYRKEDFDLIAEGEPGFLET